MTDDVIDGEVHRSAYAIGVVLRVFTPDRKIWKALSVAIRMMTDADRPPPPALRKEIVRCNSETSQSVSP
jgi:hypothetical protein